MSAFLIPAIALAIGAGASYLKQRAANKSAEEQAKLYNEWLKNRENGVNDIIERLTSGGFDPFGPQTSTSQGSEVQRTDSTTMSSQRPIITPEYSNLEQQFRTALEQRLATPTSVPVGYAPNAIRAINESLAPAKAAEQNMAARRGIPGSVLIASPVERARAGKVADVLGNLPLLERSLRNEDLAAASGAIANFGRGSEGVSRTRGVATSDRTGSITSPPNVGALANLLLPPSPNASASTGSTVGAVGGDLASALLALWASGAFKNNDIWGGGPAGA